MKKKRVIVIAINMPGYYSLATHYLKLYAVKDLYFSSCCEVYTAEYNLYVNDESILKNIFKLDPDIVAFSCYVWNIQKIIALCDKVKQRFPTKKVILGGQEVTNSTVNYLEIYPFIDYLVQGAGERTFKKLLMSLLEIDGTNLLSINGIKYRDNGRVIRSHVQETQPALDEIPSPYLSEEVKIPKQSKLGIMIDHVRGCPQQCGFCFEAMRTSKPACFSLERIEKEIIWAKSKGYRYFHILDPILCLNNIDKLKRLNSIFKRVFYCEEYRVSVEVYAEHISPATALHLDGFHIFDIGLQSIHPVANKNIRRKLDIERFIDGFARLKSLNRITNIYLIYGLPGDNYDTFMDGVCFVEDLKPSAIFLNRLLILDGTPLRHHASKFGIQFDSTPPYPLLCNDTYSYSDMQKSESFSRIFIRYYNNALQ
ncbi:MAG: radical SAM protein [bacterium]|nr:radical SAM protein [bacterium]